MPDLKYIKAGLSQSLPIAERPFKRIAKKCGLSEREFLSILRKYKKKGFIRRFGIILNHRKVGLKVNALVAWRVDKVEISKAVKILTKPPEVSHCYLRSAYPSWPYNLYTMLHALNKKACDGLIKSIAKKAGLTDYRVFRTLKEFKKTRINLSEVLK